MGITLTKTAETPTTITLGWTPPPGVGGYVFYANAIAVSTGSPNLKDGTPRKEVKFSKTNPGPPFQVAAVCRQGGILLLDVGTYSEAPPAGDLPATITQGGTYSGTRSGTVQIRTSQPVVIEDSTVTISGGADYIDANHPGCQVTLRKCTFSGGTGRVWGNAFKSFVMENCTMDKGWGVRLDNGQSGCTYVVTRNKFRNITWDGTNPSGLAHAVQPAFTPNPAHAEISWNEVINVFGQSRCEDVINVYSSSKCKVFDNYVQGAYPTTLTGGYAGGGIIIDGPASADNEVMRNIVIDTTNHGLAIAGGKNNQCHHNRAVFDGKNDAGQFFSAANIGLYVYDFSGTPAFTGNQMYGNEVAWTKANGQRNDAWLPGCQGQCSNTVLKPGQAITKADEDAEWTRWQTKLAAAGVVIGA